MLKLATRNAFSSAGIRKMFFVICRQTVKPEKYFDGKKSKRKSDSR